MKVESKEKFGSLLSTTCHVHSVFIFDGVHYTETDKGEFNGGGGAALLFASTSSCSCRDLQSIQSMQVHEKIESCFWVKTHSYCPHRNALNFWTSASRIRVGQDARIISTVRKNLICNGYIT